jgi:hypothetical protein
MSGPQTLKDSQGAWKSTMGKAFVGTRVVFRGHDLHFDLKNLDWMALYVFGITGRRLTSAQTKLLHAIWVYTSYPDPRIWNNRVAALAGTTRSTGNLAMSAGMAVSEASIYGRGIDVRAADFLIRTRKELDQGQALSACVRQELDRYRGIAGYGRPISAADERIAPMMELAQSLGLAQGAHLQLAFEIERYLLQGRWRWRMNYGSLAAALVVDLGFSAEEYYGFGFPYFLAGMQPCFIEASQQPAGTLFPLACEQIHYEGADKRPWPARCS